MRACIHSGIQTTKGSDFFTLTDIQTMMNVLKTLIAVLRCVLTHIADTLSPVGQATAWLVIDVDAMVNILNSATKTTV